ncbi:MAG TPA: lactate racemase domain-containing protein [Cyclobacteriaceae bacterium]|nr:lactate racemase domain-containing protein [Cyclobacteriaceae bacterium]
MVLLDIEKPDAGINQAEIDRELESALHALGDRKKVMAIPPDITRIHSFSGSITNSIYRILGKSLTDILPALGTHHAMGEKEIKTMFGNIPAGLFRVHNWRTDVVTVGELPGDFISEVSGNRVNYPWPAQLNRMIPEGGHDLILSIGQVVPHEVAGMAGYNKNILIGTGGPAAIHKSHFLGAVVGAENLMGRTDNPVRRVLNLASEKFTSSIPIVYILTVVGKDEKGRPVLKGLYAGDDIECFQKAAAFSAKLNIELLEKPLAKVVVYLDPVEFHSTWLGNKSVYRSRMAIRDGGELLVIAPGVGKFGEDKTIDLLIRKYGYRTTEEILELTGKNEDLQSNLSAAAHLIHGSSDGRFSITYCPGKLSREEVEGVHYNYENLETAISRYAPGKLKEGYNKMQDGEEIYYISNPALGLWSCRDRFEHD